MPFSIFASFIEIVTELIKVASDRIEAGGPSVIIIA